MKNTINYYYNLLFDDIHQNQKGFYFDLNGFRYFFILFTGDITSLARTYKVQEELLKRNIYLHQIILNKDGQIVTFINGNPYILLKALYYEGQTDLKYVLSFFNIQMYNQNKQTWKNLWSEKNDHLEYQIKQIKNRYPLINESYNYFIGMGETSIQLLNEINEESIPKVIAHKRIESNSTLFDLYNPLNLIIDYRLRDITEYFKANFFADKKIDAEVKTFFQKIKLTTDEYYLFLARMLYPTYYFDLYEQIISGKQEEAAIKKIINKINDYEQFLKNIYTYFKTFLPMLKIDWLETT